MICGRRKKKSALIVLILISLIICLGSIYHKLKSFSKNRRNEYFLKLEEAYDDDNENEEHVYKQYYENAAVKRRIQGLKKIIKHLNENQRVLNDKLFRGPEFQRFVIVVQVRSEIKHLAIFLDSLRRVTGIKRCLLVFSHDFYDDDINNAIRNITFSKVMQIYYPYSTQLHPKIFPGHDRKFCSKLYECVRSQRRQHVLSQQKLFWWWTVNEVFERLEILKNYKGYVYLLETGQYVLKDFIYMTKMMENLQPVYCPECVVVGTAARRPRPDLYRLHDARLVVGMWGWSNFINSGIGFNRTAWDTIKQLEEHFCYFNDYNWDHSLRYLASKTASKQFSMLSTEAPRVLATIGCGLYDNSTTLNCPLAKNFFVIQKFIWKIRTGLFPHNFSLKREDMVFRDASEQVGNWSDTRDQEFCMFMASKGRREYY